MTPSVENKRQPAVRLHLTNVAGAGATQLLQSLLPALERSSQSTIVQINLPDREALASYAATSTSARLARYRRRLPNAISRLLECTLFGRQFDGKAPLLVLGDLPLRCRAPQTVFVQTSHLLRPARFRWSVAAVKFAISRMIFRLNMHCASAFIVQTQLMKDALISTYPAVAGKVHVIAQPVPAWLLQTKLVRTSRKLIKGEGLNLIYPAASSPHKNHKLLSGIASQSAGTWPVQRLVLTVAEELNPAPSVAWINCLGFLSAQQMIQAYSDVDALLFLSQDESYGFPLVEAMFIGLPIICPDLPYARTLCGDEAVYFESNNLSSLKKAVSTMNNKINSGWWPDWSEQMSLIPASWEAVADGMLSITTASRHDTQ
ncbi:MAG: glycosyltransferase [Polaromonas sp.]